MVMLGNRGPWITWLCEQRQKELEEAWRWWSWC